MELKEIIQKLSAIDGKLPHGSNLRTKIVKESKRSSKNEEPTKEIGILYLAFHEAIKNLDKLEVSKEWISEALKYLEVYYTHIKSKKFKIFSHQSDFLSSLLPEFFYRMYMKFIISRHGNLIIETQKDLTIDLSFLPYKKTSVNFKSKRVDVAILKPCELILDKKNIGEFNIPLIAVEVKTNLDKNMIAGVEYSVQRLKRTFPLCKYYLVSEFVDFAFYEQNYASSAIDEILIKRKQKRSEIRKDLNKLNPIDFNLMYEHLIEVTNFLEMIIKDPIILSERLKKGRLIK